MRTGRNADEFQLTSVANPPFLYLCSDEGTRYSYTMASRGLLDLYARVSRYTTRRSRVGVSNHSSVQIQ